MTTCARVVIREAGHVMAGIVDVAALAGVTAAVVSRVLNDDTTLRVAPQTRERVLAAAKELNYVPRHAARALRSRKANAITLVVPEATSALFSELLRGVEAGAHDLALTVVLARAERVVDEPEWLARLVNEGRTDGVILQPPERLPPARLAAIAEIGAPVVLINDEEHSSLNTVVLDDAAGIRTAVEHLADLGHRRIAMVGGAEGHSTATRRLAGFRSIMSELGLPLREEWITQLGYSGDSGRLAARSILRGSDWPTGVVAANINAGMGFLAEIHAHGLDVPREMSLVALHDTWYADFTWPPMTTVAMPLHEVGMQAVALLTGAIESPVRHVLIERPEPALRVRGSTGRIG